MNEKMLEVRVFQLEQQIRIIPSLVNLCEQLQADIKRLEASASEEGALRGEKPDRKVDIDPRLAVLARRAVFVEKESQKNVQTRLDIPQSKLRGVLGWSKTYFTNYLNEHQLNEVYNTGVLP
jgi:hypothetical protein